MHSLNKKTCTFEGCDAVVYDRVDPSPYYWSKTVLPDRCIDHNRCVVCAQNTDELKRWCYACFADHGKTWFFHDRPPIPKEQSGMILSHMATFRLSRDMINYIANMLHPLDVLMWAIACGFKFKPLAKYANHAIKMDRWHQFKWLMRNGCCWNRNFGVNTAYIIKKGDAHFLNEYYEAALMLRNWNILKNVNVLEMAYEAGAISLFKANYLQLNKKVLPKWFLLKAVIQDDAETIKWLDEQDDGAVSFHRDMIKVAVVNMKTRVTDYMVQTRESLVEKTIGGLEAWATNNAILTYGIQFIDWLVERKINPQCLELFDVARSLLLRNEQADLVLQVLHKACQHKIAPDSKFINTVISEVLDSNSPMGIGILKWLCANYKLNSEKLTKVMTTAIDNYNGLKYPAKIFMVINLLKDAGAKIVDGQLMKAISNKDVELLKWCVENSNLEIDNAIFYYAEIFDPAGSFVYLQQVRAARKPLPDSP